MPQAVKTFGIPVSVFKPYLNILTITFWTCQCNEPFSNGIEEILFHRFLFWW